MASRREILADSIERWRAEGVIDAPTHERLLSRLDTEPAQMGTAPVRADGDIAGARSFAGETTQFVGGLLLGAALVALVVFLDLQEDPSRWVMLALGALVIAAASALHMRAPGERTSLVEAAFAVGFVPLGVAAIGGFGEGTSTVSIIAALIGVGVHVLKRGRGPTMLLCVAVVSLASFSATASLFDGVSAARAGSWLIALLAYLGLTLVWRRESWSSAGAGMLVIPLTIAYVMLLSKIAPEGESIFYEAAIGAFLGLLLITGVFLGVRGLVATSAAGLTIDAVVFAFDQGNLLTGVAVLLALGGLLVWQGQGIRTYFRRGSQREGL